MYLFLSSAFRVLRVLLLLTGATAPVLAFVFMARNDAADAFAAYLLAGGTLLVALWAWVELWLLWWLGFTAAAASFAVAGRPVSAGLALAALLAPVVVHVAVERRYLQSFRDSEVDLTGPEAPVPPVDAKSVAVLEAAGFRRLGVHRWRVGEWESATTLLIARERDRIASITDGDLELASRFGERTLVTRMRPADWPAPPDFLCQEIAYGRPDAVVAAHQNALALLAVRGLRARLFATDADAYDYVRAGVEEFIRDVSAARWRGFLEGAIPRHPIDHLLGDDERSRRRIDAWLGER